MIFCNYDIYSIFCLNRDSNQITFRTYQNPIENGKFTKFYVFHLMVELIPERTAKNIREEFFPDKDQLKK